MSPQTTPAEPTQERLEGTALVLHWLASTEYQVRRMYSDLYALAMSTGFIPAKNASEYNAIRDRYVNSAKPIVDQLNKDAQSAGQPVQPLNIPARLEFDEGQLVQIPASNLGLYGAVLPSVQLVRASGLRLTIPELTPDQAPTSLHGATLGVPVAAWGVAKTTAVILGVVVVVYLLVPVLTKLLDTIGGFTGLPQMQIEAKSKADMTARLVELAAPCMDVAATAEQKAACVANAAAAIEKASESGVSSGWRFRQWVALIAATVIVGTSGYLVYRYIGRRRRKQDSREALTETSLHPAVGYLPG